MREAGAPTLKGFEKCNMLVVKKDKFSYFVFFPVHSATTTRVFQFLGNTRGRELCEKLLKKSPALVQFERGKQIPALGKEVGAYLIFVISFTQDFQIPNSTPKKTLKTPQNTQKNP